MRPTCTSSSACLRSSACDGQLGALEGWQPLTEADLETVLVGRDRAHASPARRLPHDRRAGHVLHGPRPRALPRQRLQAARLDLVRLPHDPHRGSRLRAPRPPEGRPATRRGAPRPDPRHRRDRLGEVDDARGDHRPHQPDAAPAHRDDRGSDRVPPHRPRLHRQPARGRPRHRLVPAGSPPCAAPGPRRDPDRRAPRRRVRARPRSRRPSRATSSSRRCTPSMPPRRSAA